MKIYKFILQVFIALFCTITNAQPTSATYTVHNNELANPERGFYRYTETRASNLQPLTVNQLNQIRQQDLYTIVFRYVYLDAFMNSPISAVFLANMQNDFTTLRNAGFKIVLRFAYTSDWNGSSTGPFNDSPSKAQLLQHIVQLKPLVQQNGDVILTIQNGFWGIWGENYYSDVFGCECNNTLNAARWLDRRQVSDSLLAILPSNRFLSARYPTLKSRMYNLTIPTDSITLAQAHTSQTKSRIGYHNDCFLVAANDYTFGNTAVEKPFWEKESRYTIMGGETCGDNTTYANCSNALQDLVKGHWTYLNYDYHPDVISRWQNNGCLEGITNRLGYRLALNQASSISSVCGGTLLPLSLTLTNSGFAAPVHERSVILVLRNANATYTFPLTVDPRTWYGGTTLVLNMQIPIPASILPGTYDLLLHLPDPSPSLSTNTKYAIQLANDGLWEASTGYHSLNLSVIVPEETDCSGLPLNFIRFETATDVSNIHLTWQVLLDKDNLSHFIIERSLDGKHFDEIGKIEIKDIVRPQTVLTHHFIDEHSPAGNCYYRVMAKDYDGSHTYSWIQHVEKNKPTTLTISPNPSDGVFTLSGNLAQVSSDKQLLSLFNSIGQPVYRSEFYTENSFFTTTIDISQLPAGIYLVKTGDNQAREILIKN